MIGRLGPGLGATLAVAIGAAAALGACVEPRTPRFPHAHHLAAARCGAPGEPACLGCNDCHADGERGGPHRRPTEAVCTRCHEGGSADVRAILAAPVERPSGAIRFDHARHLDRSGVRGQCVPCHAGVVAPERPSLPPMETCFGCHVHREQWEQRRCAPCHDPADLARTLPRTFLRHDAAFERRHGEHATADAALCATCHTESSCDACHDVTNDLKLEARRPRPGEREAVHGGDFLVRHPIEAAAAPATCVRCHAPATCDACHLERGVSGNGRTASTPHPPGWIGTNPASADFHGRAARRDIVSCAGCHEAGPATNCIRCHKVGGYGGNPHPAGWRSARAPTDATCGYCHG